MSPESKALGEPVAWRRVSRAGSWTYFNSPQDAKAEFGGVHDAPLEPLYASPIREPEISREAVKQLVRKAIEDAQYSAIPEPWEVAEHHAGIAADAILNLASPVAKGASEDAELSAEFDRPGRVSNAEGHSAEGAADPALSGARGVGEGWRPISECMKLGERRRWDNRWAAGRMTEGQRKFLVESEPDDIDGTEGCGVELWTSAHYAIARSLAKQGFGRVFGPGQPKGMPGLYFNNTEGLQLRQTLLNEESQTNGS